MMDQWGIKALMSWEVWYSTQWDWCARTRVMVLHGSSLFLCVVGVPAGMSLISRELLSHELLNDCAQECLIPASISQLDDWTTFSWELKLFFQRKCQAPEWTLVQLLMVVVWQEQSQDQRLLDWLICEEGKVEGAVRQFSQECSRHVWMPLPFQGNHDAHMCMF